MEVFDCIKNRYSVRKYKDKPIKPELINKILETSIWAPSGKNGQPWRIRVITDKEQIKEISALSIYKAWMDKAPCLLAVFLDKGNSYNYVKDVMACGALFQNIMLCAYSLSIGSCWIGEILPKEKLVKSILGIENEKYDLMGIITLGYKSKQEVHVGRKDLKELYV